MLPKHSLAMVTSAERQLLRQQWQRSGKCVRCFHASTCTQKEQGEGLDGSRNVKKEPSEGNKQRAPYNKPERGPTRHQRAAMISEEVRILNRDTPNLGPSKLPSKNEIDFTVEQQGQGMGAAGAKGRMGENVDPAREGPDAQGTAREVRSIDDKDLGGQTASTREVRTPEAGIEEPARGGQSIMAGAEGAEAASLAEKRAQPEDEDDTQEVEEGEEGGNGVPQQPDLVTKPQRTPTAKRPGANARLPQPGPAFSPSAPTAAELTSSGNGTATIAANNFSGVIADRLSTIAVRDPNNSDSNVTSLAQRLLQGQFVRFASTGERDAVFSECARIDPRLSPKTDQAKAAEATKNPKREQPYFAPLSDKVRQGITEKMANGLYDKDAVLAKGSGEKTRHKQPVLNEIEKTLMRNGTYLEKDRERLMKRVREMLPAQQQGERVGGKASGEATGQQKQARK